MKVLMALVIAFVFHLMTLAACGTSSPAYGLSAKRAVLFTSASFVIENTPLRSSGDVSFDVPEDDEDDESDGDDEDNTNPPDENDDDSEGRDDENDENQNKKYRYNFIVSSDILHFELMMY